MCAAAECDCYEYDPRDFIDQDREVELNALVFQFGPRPSVASVLRRMRTRRGGRR